MTNRGAIMECTRCPACGASAGAPCRTVINGVDVQWTHDLRVIADLAHDAEMAAARDADRVARVRVEGEAS